VTQITMVNNFGRPKDSISALNPPGVGGQNFSATWLRSN
jgi:hypothetical protein